MRILFITSTRIGDAVLSSGVLDRLLREHPGARVTVACGRLPAPLFLAVPGLERVIVIDKRPLDLHWLELWLQTAPRRWDWVVDLRRSAIGYLLRTKRRTVSGESLPGEHKVLQLARTLAFVPPPAPRVWLTDADRGVAARLVPEGPPVLAIGPAANWAGKQWRPQRFAELARRLTAPGGALPGARVAVLAAAHERAQARPVIEGFTEDRVIDLAGRLGLPAAAACLARCRLFVGNDSGLMHLAAAAGIATLGLFGPSQAWRYAPWGPRCVHVGTPESRDQLFARLDHDPATLAALMDGLTVDAVADAAARLIAASEDPRGEASPCSSAAGL